MQKETETFYCTSNDKYNSTLTLVNCNEEEMNRFIIGLSISSFISFLSMVLSIKGTIDNIEIKLKLKIIKVFSRFRFFPIPNNESSIYIKLYYSYLQIFAVFNLKSYISEIGNSLISTPNGVLYSANCLFDKFHSEIIGKEELKLTFMLIIPFVYFFAFTLAYFLFIRKPLFHRKYLPLYSIFFFTFLYFQPSVLENIIPILIFDYYYCCRYKPSYDCYHRSNISDYLNYFLVIRILAFLIWVVGIPGTILYKLIKNKTNLDSIANYVRYGYFYEEYKIFYWEFIRIYEKLLIIIAIRLFNTLDSLLSRILKSLLVISILYVYRILFDKYNPYKSEFLNKTEKFSNFVCFCTLIFGLIFLNIDTYAQLFVFSIILILNIAFNIYILICIFRSLPHISK